MFWKMTLRKSTTKFGIKVKVLKRYVSQPENNIKDSNSEFSSEFMMYSTETRVSNQWYLSNCFHQD